MTTPLFKRRIRPIVVEALQHARIVLISPTCSAQTSSGSGTTTK